jgi:hypothetical protein
LLTGSAILKKETVRKEREEEKEKCYLSLKSNSGATLDTVETADADVTVALGLRTRAGN